MVDLGLLSPCLGLIIERECSLCSETDETLDHILFECRYSKAVWKHVLQWIGITREPNQWSMEIIWLMQMAAKKGWRFKLLKTAVSETVYGIWQYRNEVIFGKQTHRSTGKEIGDRIIEK